MIGPVSDAIPVARFVTVMIKSLRRGLKHGKTMMFIVTAHETGSQVIFVINDAVADNKADVFSIETHHFFNVVGRDNKMLQATF